MWDHWTLVLAQNEAPPAPVAGAPAQSSGAGGGQPVGTTTSTGTPSGGPPATQPTASPFGGMWPMFVALAVVWIVMMVFPQRRDKKKREALLASIEKGDRVQTSAGIIGSVVEVRDNEILLKVDEGTNTRIRFTRLGHRRNLEQERRSGG